MIKSQSQSSSRQTIIGTPTPPGTYRGERGDLSNDYTPSLVPLPRTNDIPIEDNVPIWFASFQKGLNSGARKLASEIDRKLLELYYSSQKKI